MCVCGFCVVCVWILVFGGVFRFLSTNTDCESARPFNQQNLLSFSVRLKTVTCRVSVQGVCVCARCKCVVRIQIVKAHGLSVLIRLLDSLFQNERPKTESAPPLYTRPHTPNTQSTRDPRTHQTQIPSSLPLSTPSTNFTHADTKQTKHTDSKHQIHTHSPNTSVHIPNTAMCLQSCETLHITICSEITCKSFFFALTRDLLKYTTCSTRVRSLLARRLLARSGQYFESERSRVTLGGCIGLGSVRRILRFDALLDISLRCGRSKCFQLLLLQCGQGCRFFCRGYLGRAPAGRGASGGALDTPRKCTWGTQGGHLAQGTQDVKLQRLAVSAKHSCGKNLLGVAVAQSRIAKHCYPLCALTFATNVAAEDLFRYCMLEFGTCCAMTERVP